jgi:hypothetical protein
VQLADRPEPNWFVLELATYPEELLREQLARDTLLVWLNRRRLPEVLAIVLHPKGNLEAARFLTLRSDEGLTELAVGWRVVELWKLPARELLDAGDVGLIPWVPLTQFDGPPEPVLRQCREIIDRRAAPEEHGNLLAVTQVLTLRYNEAGLLSLLGGRKVMIESPLIQEIVAETRAETRSETILEVLETRFGPIPRGIGDAVRGIRDDERLRLLMVCAVRCSDLEEFNAALR